MYRQDVLQTSMQSVIPDLATGWSWNEEGTDLTFPLRQGVKWHDGKPFTARDVKCTWDLLTGKANEKLRVNPGKSWYTNLEDVVVKGDYEVTFRLKRPQARIDCAIGLRVVADLSLPRVTARHAQSSDRYWPVQIRRIQAQRVDQADAQPRLLEAGSALSRRYRIHDHQRDRDTQSGVFRRQVRRDLALWRDRPDLKGLCRAGAAGNLPSNGDKRQSNDDHQFERGAL
jgi:hypothetical protein